MPDAFCSVQEAPGYVEKLTMPRTDPDGPRMLRIYRSAEQPVTFEEFCTLCRIQGLGMPSNRMFVHIRRLYRNGARHYLPINAHDQELLARQRGWTPERVRALLSSGARETTTLEFKEAIGDGPKVRKTFASMANAGGGVVVFGIKESDSVAASVTPLTARGVEEQLTSINQRVDPPVDLTLTSLAWGNGRAVVVVQIRAAGPGTVHLVDGHAPIRDGATTRSMGSDELRRWIQEGKRSA